MSEKISIQLMMSDRKLKVFKERARNEGTTGPKSLHDTRYTTYARPLLVPTRPARLRESLWRDHVGMVHTSGRLCETGAKRLCFGHKAFPAGLVLLRHCLRGDAYIFKRNIFLFSLSLSPSPSLSLYIYIFISLSRRFSTERSHSWTHIHHAANQIPNSPIQSGNSRLK